MKNIVIAIDFSPLTEQLIEQGRALGQAFGAKLWLVHVAAPSPDFVGFEAGPQHVRDDRAEELRKEHRNLQTYAQRLGQEGIAADALLVQGPTVRTLLEETYELGADLLIIGTHTHGWLYEKLVGSVEAELINATKVPLLVIPAIGKT